MVFNGTFNNISAISWRRKLEYVQKTTDLSQVTDKLYHIILYQPPRQKRDSNSQHQQWLAPTAQVHVVLNQTIIRSRPRRSPGNRANFITKLLLFPCCLCRYVYNVVIERQLRQVISSTYVVSFILYSETCLNQTLNKPESCIYLTLNKVQISLLI